MFTILANQCRKKLRRQNQPEELTEDVAALEQDHAGEQDVRDAFSMLSEKDRMIVACSVLGGYASEEIGRLLEMNPATVRSRKARALEKMRQVLGLPCV